MMKPIVRFFEACANGDVATLRAILADEPGMARMSNPDAAHEGWTGLHTAARSGHLEVVVLLLAHGADPNAREAGDNTYPLHWAAAHNHLEVVRALLDAGGDVHGLGDVHQLDTIGWAAFFHDPDDDSGELDPSRRELIAFLIERGARHHIFSAMCVGDLALIREVVTENRAALDRRMSRFEHGLTPLHFAISRKRYDIVDLLIELGVDLEATDGGGQTALAVAMLHGDREAIRRLHAAGAKPPRTMPAEDVQAGMAKLAESVTKIVPMIYVPDIARALDWYVSIGFKELARYEDDGVVNFGIVSFGSAELMLNIANARPGSHGVSLWFNTDRIDDLYQLLKSRQLAAAQAALDGEAADSAGIAGIEFEQDLEQMFYGARQFCVRDPNGYELYFIQSDTP